ATGVGKTEIARRLARIADAPFVKVEASKFTEVGYVGRDVESMVRDLMEQAVNMVKKAKEQEVRPKALQQVEDLLLDALIPPLEAPDSELARGKTDGLQTEETRLNAQTRERFRKKLKNGELDDRKVEINVSHVQPMGIGMLGGGMLDESSLASLQDMLHSALPRRTKKKKVTIAEAKKLLLPEETHKLIDMDVVKEEALAKAQYTGIIFIDEIDKIAGSSAERGSGPDVSREGVQRDLLPIVEGSAINTKYGLIYTDHILFIAAGAFHVSKPSDLIPELQGRFPIRVELDNLTKEDFHRILLEPKNALTKQYKALFEAEAVQLSFDEDALEEIAANAFSINEQVENIGARRLHTVMSHLLNSFLFDVPDKIGPDEPIHITKALVRQSLADLLKRKEVSEYIL
ncbi:MAG: ATP-dependent protease ATPase subunit HslU, partial [Bacteroidota bacterium]